MTFLMLGSLFFLIMVPFSAKAMTCNPACEPGYECYLGVCRIKDTDFDYSFCDTSQWNKETETCGGRYTTEGSCVESTFCEGCEPGYYGASNFITGVPYCAQCPLPSGVMVKTFASFGAAWKDIGISATCGVYSSGTEMGSSSCYIVPSSTVWDAYCAYKDDSGAFKLSDDCEYASSTGGVRPVL